MRIKIEGEELKAYIRKIREDLFPEKLVNNTNYEWFFKMECQANEEPWIEVWCGKKSLETLPETPKSGQESGLY